MIRGRDSTSTSTFCPRERDKMVTFDNQ